MASELTKDQLILLVSLLRRAVKQKIVNVEVSHDLDDPSDVQPAYRVSLKKDKIIVEVNI